MTTLDFGAKGLFPALTERIARAGHSIHLFDGVQHASDAVAVQAIIDAFTLADARAPVIAAIKEEARRRILMFLPDWKQSNLNARANELNAITHRVNARRIAGTVTPDDLAAEAAVEAELLALNAVWDRARAIRDASNVLEQSLAALDFAALATFDVADPAHWPEP